MNLGDLINRLNELERTLGEDVPVTVATSEIGDDMDYEVLNVRPYDYYCWNLEPVDWEDEEATRPAVRLEFM